MQRIMLGYEKAPSLEDVRRVANAIMDMGAKLSFMMLAETDLRPIEIFNLKIDQVDLEKRVIKPLHISKTKRAYI